MNLINPHCTKIETPEEQDLNTYQTQVGDWLINNTNEKISFDEIRAFFSKTRQDWPDGVIHSRLLKWGYEVTPEGF